MKDNNKANKPTEKDYQDAIPSPEQAMDSPKYVSSDLSTPPNRQMQPLDLTENITPEYAGQQQNAAIMQQQGFDQGNISAQYGQYPEKQQENTAAAMHLVSNFLPAGLFTSAVGYGFLGKKGPFLKKHLRTLLNFHLTLVPVGFATMVMGVMDPSLGMYAATGVGGFAMACGAMGAYNAKKGKDFTYPSIEFIKDKGATGLPNQNYQGIPQQQYQQLPQQQQQAIGQAQPQYLQHDFMQQYAQQPEPVQNPQGQRHQQYPNQ